MLKNIFASIFSRTGLLVVTMLFIFMTIGSVVGTKKSATNVVDPIVAATSTDTTAVSHERLPQTDKKVVSSAIDTKKNAVDVVDASSTDAKEVSRKRLPVWFEIPLNTTEPYDAIQFTYEFLSAKGAEGIMTVFVDDNPVYKIDERITSAGTTTTPAIPVGDLAPGRHTLGFRIDPYTDIKSSARITNIVLVQL